jgi:hypothetical protein
MVHISVRGLHEVGQEGGSITGDPEIYVKKIYQERRKNAL